MDSHAVDRDFAALHQPGGELYTPSSIPVISEMTDNEVVRLKRLLSYCRALPTSDSRYQSTMVFDVEKLLSATSLPSSDLPRVGRDFLGAIENAKKTDLVPRGPLDLKSVNTIPPRIVLDQEVSVRTCEIEIYLTGISSRAFIRVFLLCSLEEGAVQHVT
jgi:hypothetical protein